MASKKSLDEKIKKANSASHEESKDDFFDVENIREKQTRPSKKKQNFIV